MLDGERRQHRVGDQVRGDLVAGDEFTQDGGGTSGRWRDPRRLGVQPGPHTAPGLIGGQRLGIDARVGADPQERAERLPRDPDAPGCRAAPPSASGPTGHGAPTTCRSHTEAGWRRSATVLCLVEQAQDIADVRDVHSLTHLVGGVLVARRGSPASRGRGAQGG